MIKASGLTKIFNDKKKEQVIAANQVTFSVSPGEIFGLLGLNLLG